MLWQHGNDNVKNEGKSDDKEKTKDADEQVNHLGILLTLSILTLNHIQFVSLLLRVCLFKNF